MPIGKLEALFCAVVLAAFALPSFAHEAENVPVFWASGQSEAAERINDVLRSPLTPAGLDFEAAPLEEVVAFLRDEYEIEIQLDRNPIEDEGLNVDEPTTCHLQNISLGSALKLMLRQHDMTYIISDEVLMITTFDEALTQDTTAVYPVGDLLESGTQPLEDTILSCVASDTWVENGGQAGEVCFLEPGLMVVTQTQDVHEEIGNLLSALRRARANGMFGDEFEPRESEGEESHEEELEEENEGEYEEENDEEMEGEEVSLDDEEAAEETEDAAPFGGGPSPVFDETQIGENDSPFEE